MYHYSMQDINTPKHFHYSVHPKLPDCPNGGSSTLGVSVSPLISSSCTFSACLTQFIYIKSRILCVFFCELKVLTSEILKA